MSGERETAAERKLRILKRVWALADKFLAQAHEPPWADAAELVDAVKLAAGLVLPGHSLQGNFFARLVSSRVMTVAQVDHLHDQVIKHLSELLGEDVNQLLPPQGVRGEDGGGNPGPQAKAAAAVPPEEEGGASSGRDEALIKEFRDKMVRLGKDPAEGKPNERAQTIKNVRQFWLEKFGPAYTGMVLGVTDTLIDYLDGKVGLDDALRYVDSKTKYWNPKPGRRP